LGHQHKQAGVNGKQLSQLANHVRSKGTETTELCTFVG
jgi:hypothetical protein